MPVNADEHRRLMAYSYIHQAECSPAAFRKGFDAGLHARSRDANPYRLAPLNDSKGRQKMDGAGKLLFRSPTLSRISWFEGWDEGHASREGRLLDLMRERAGAK